MEKKYLTLPKKIAYGMDDSAWCFISLIVSSFMMIYLTDTVGLDPAIIGTLMFAARIFDGISDLIFGYILDKTHTKYGKARPWMFWSMIGCAIGLVVLFATPESMGDTAKYVWFFVFYMLVNTVFYTSGYISYSTLMSLITRNRAEQVQVTSYRTIAGNLSYMILGSITLSLVTAFGGGASGWRTVAIVYAVIGIIINTISVFANQELPEETVEVTDVTGNEEIIEKTSLKDNLKSVLTCRYFYGTILILLIAYISASVFQTAAAYYATYVWGDANIMAPLSIINYGVTMLVAFLFSLLAKKTDSQKLSLFGIGVGVIGRIICIIGGISGSFTMLLVGLAIGTVCNAAVQTTVYTMMASTTEYLWRRDRVRVNGIVFATSSMGIKLGTGIATALSGVLLGISGYVANATVQSETTINMLNFMVLWLPLILVVLLAVVYLFMDVDKKLDEMPA